MEPTTPKADRLGGTTWTVLVFEFIAVKAPCRTWLYVIPSPRGSEDEFERLAGGGPPVLWPPATPFLELRGARFDLMPKVPPSDLRTAFRVWKCCVRHLLMAGYDVNHELNPYSE